MEPRGVWLRQWPGLILLLVAGFGLVFAAGDGRELVHQLDESNAGIAVIAAILIGLHLAVAALAAALFLSSTDADRSTAAELAT
jgi:energy-coupling factor transporter transmembrane protein EcfT